MTQALPIRFQEHLQVREMKVQVISFLPDPHSRAEQRGRQRKDAPFDCESRAEAMAAWKALKNCPKSDQKVESRLL